MDTEPDLTKMTMTSDNAQGAQMDDMVRVTTAIQVAYRILAARLTILLGLMMTFGLFAWAMAQATWVHLGGAVAFGVLVFLPILFGSNRSGEP